MSLLVTVVDINLAQKPNVPAVLYSWLGFLCGDTVQKLLGHFRVYYFIISNILKKSESN